MVDILIVDDARDVCNAMVKLLRAMGHAAKGVYSGEEALIALSEGAPLPGLVILDQLMPGLKGVDVLAAIRQEPRTSRLPVVVFSALDDPLFELEAVRAGATAFWSKVGLNYTTLGERIEAVIAANPAGHVDRSSTDGHG